MVEPDSHAPAPPSASTPSASTPSASTPSAPPMLGLTGERTVPGVGRENYWFRRHEAVYAWLGRTPGIARPGARVLEAGSGEGYGAAMLRAAGAAVVVALEYDAGAVGHAVATYPDVATVRANLAALPIGADAVDLVVSLQVAEHLWDLPGFLRDCTRVLRPAGVLVLSTPNRLTFSPGLARGQRPTNPFHVEEFDAGQLRELLATAGFDGIVLHGLRHGPRLVADEREHGDLVAAQVAAVLAEAPPHEGWDDALLTRVAAVAVDDFTIDDYGSVDYGSVDYRGDNYGGDDPCADDALADALDLIVVARCR